jgi:hypothetical protein
MRAVTVAGPEIVTVTFHSEDVPIIRVRETPHHLMEGAVPLREYLAQNCTAPAGVC